MVVPPEKAEPNPGRGINEPRSPESPQALPKAPPESAPESAPGSAPDSMPPGGDAPRMPLMAWRDVSLGLSLAAMTVISWSLPERHWRGVALGVERLLWRVRREPRAGKRERLARIERLIAGSAAGTGTTGAARAARAESILRGYSVYSHIAKLQLLRCHRPGGWWPKGWTPRIELVGEDRLRSALDSGRGAILWVPPTAAGDLVTKMALHRAGFPVSHLSRYTHGFSSTRFGHRVLNPIRTIAERRFLAERLEMGPAGPFVRGGDGPEHATDALARRLDAGQIVSIALVDAQARKPRFMPLLNGWLPVGDGAIRLARRTGAALFPVVTLMREDGGFVTTIEPALAVPAAGGGAKDTAGSGADNNAAAEEVLGTFGRVLERHVPGAPEQFSFWYHAVDSPRPPK